MEKNSNTLLGILEAKGNEEKRKERKIDPQCILVSLCIVLLNLVGVNFCLLI